VSAIVHTPEAIEALLRRGLTPKTDNLDALLELGFERAVPQAEDGYDATLWERSREYDRRASNGSRLFVRERAVLDRSEQSASPHAELMPDEPAEVGCSVAADAA